MNLLRSFLSVFQKHYEMMASVRYVLQDSALTVKTSYISSVNQVEHTANVSSWKWWEFWSISPEMHSVNQSIHNFYWVFLETPVRNCIVGMLLTRPITVRIQLVLNNSLIWGFTSLMIWNVVTPFFVHKPNTRLHLHLSSNW